MKRRPHWTDDLIEAVKDAISGWCFDHVEGPLYDEDVYPVIAAVEDWQVQHARDRVVLVTGNPGTYVGDLEAAIQRVRELCNDERQSQCSCGACPIYVDARDIARALDGDA